MQNDFTPKESLRLIERSFPEGTIYTIYALNLRFLFQLGSEKKLRNEIDKIGLESLIITWIKARYLQKKFELKYPEKIKKLTESTELDTNPSTLKEKIDNLVNEYKSEYSDPKKSIKDPTKLIGMFLNELINLKGEGFYSSNKDEETIKKLVFELKCLEVKFNKRLEKELEIEHQLKELEQQKKSGESELEEQNKIQKQITKLVKKKDVSINSKKSLYDNRIEAIRNLCDENLPDFTCYKEIESILKKIDEIHRRINKDRRDKKQGLYNEIRRAEQFLASDEFGKFAKDPFFKISKNETRIIEINGKKLELKDVTEEENKLLQNGHEFSIFRGHLKDNWLNALTYKVENLSENASYYIRLSKLGLLQIRKEKYLGTYGEKISEGLPPGNLFKKFKKSLEIFQSQNNLFSDKEIKELESEVPDNLSEEEKEFWLFGKKLNVTSEKIGIASESDKFKKLQETLKAKNLIDVLKYLLEHRKRYERKSEIDNQPDEENKDNKNIDDILQVAAGFAQLLEFKTNSNYTGLFGEQEISPLNLEDLRKKRKSLERQKYTVLLFNDIKKAKNKDESSDESFQPLCLKNKFPEAISCFLQGSLEEASAKNSEGIKVLQYLNDIEETGCFDKKTRDKLGINPTQEKYRYGDNKYNYGKYEYDEFEKCQQKELNKKIKDVYLIPDFSSLEENDYIDLSTLKDELCIFTAERSLIFFSDKETLESGNNPGNYARYWRCIVRGIEYTVALRATLQLLESRTTRLLEGIPEILELSNSQKNNEENSDLKQTQESVREKSKEAEKRLNYLAEDLASILKILPGLRSIAIPTNAFRSGHSVKKFNYLYNNCFKFEDILKNIQKNIDELTNFLTFFEQQQEAQEDKKLNKIALLFTVASIIYVSVSFMQDFYGFFGISKFSDIKEQRVSFVKLFYVCVYIILGGFVWYFIRRIESKYSFSQLFRFTHKSKNRNAKNID